MTLVYLSQASSVVLYIQNSDFSIRKTSLYGTQPSSLAFKCKTATLGPDLQVSVSHTSPMVFSFKTATLVPKLQVSMRPSPHLLFCEFTTASL